ncbi:MAG: hypothetical protein O8C59_04495 [Candidatus Methanoperedens sp.]|nr:hypothetical protein [Candidatus Methanoperedens sp.]
MDILDTSAYTKEESVRILSKELEEHPRKNQSGYSQKNWKNILS